MKPVHIALACGVATLTLAFSAAPTFAQAGADRTTDQYLCKDIMRDGGGNRDVAIAFIHGVLLGKSGDTKFNLETLAKQTDSFIDHCLDHPNDKAMDAMTKIKK